MIEFIQEKSEKIPKRWRGLSLSFEKFEFRGLFLDSISGANRKANWLEPMQTLEVSALH